MAKFGDPVKYDSGNGVELGFITKKLDNGNVNIAWYESDAGTWHSENDVPQQDGGGRTWKPA